MKGERPRRWRGESTPEGKVLPLIFSLGGNGDDWKPLPRKEVWSSVTEENERIGTEGGLLSQESLSGESVDR